MSEPPDFKSHRDSTVLTLGVIALVCGLLGPGCFLGSLAAIPVGLVAWFMGRSDLKAMHCFEMDSSGKTNTNAGHWLGLLGAVLGVLMFLALFALSILFNPSGGLD